jgi:hypothetical protein
MKILTAINESIVLKSNKMVLQKHYNSHLLTQQKYITKIALYYITVLYKNIKLTLRSF